MLKSEKRSFKQLKGKSQRKPFLEMLVGRLALQKNNTLARWEMVYRRKCAKRNVPCPLDRLNYPEIKTKKD